MLEGLEFKYTQNILYSALAAGAVIFFALSFAKKEKILALLHLDCKIRLKALRIMLISLGLACMVFSLLGPQILQGYVESQKLGTDIYILIDTSKSMLVSDVKPDRLSVAKRIVEGLLDGMQGDRVGFIPFASDAYIQMPLTHDYQLARMFLDVMDTDMIGGGGTNLAAAIKLAVDSFERAADTDGVIIVISDGEEHDGASQNALSALNASSYGGMKIYTIGVGTQKGGLVPVYDAGGAVADYIKDDSGNPVTSRLNSDTLQKLAQAGNGTYYPVQTGAQGGETSSMLNALLDEMSNLQRDVRAVQSVGRFQQIYQYFLGAGIFLFLIAWFLPERRVAI